MTAAGGRPGTRTSTRGLAGTAWLAASITAALFLLVVLAPTRVESSAAYRDALEAALTGGPGAGTWRIHELWGDRVNRFAPHPTDPEAVLVMRVEERSRPPGRGAPRVHAWSRRMAAGIVSMTPRDLFFDNYDPQLPPVAASLEDGTKAVRVRWVPRQDQGGETSRTVWHDARTLQVLRIEDRSHLGHLIHAISRISPDTGGIEATPVARPDWGKRGGKPAKGPKKTLADAPFPVLEPAHLPPGYRRTRAEYREFPVWPRPGEAADASGERRRIRMATFLYSDGLGTFSVGIASREDMDRLERAFARMKPPTSPDAPDPCPVLPGEAVEIREGAMLIRRRADRCRTVLRVDDVEGVSVVVMGQNEVPGDEYVQVIRSLEPVQPASEEEPLSAR